MVYIWIGSLNPGWQSAEWSSMTNMFTMGLAVNKFTKLAAGWAEGMPNMTQFYIHNNSLQGSLPAGECAIHVVGR